MRSRWSNLVFEAELRTAFLELAYDFRCFSSSLILVRVIVCSVRESAAVGDAMMFCVVDIKVIDSRRGIYILPSLSW